MMKTINISLPSQQLEVLEDQVKHGMFASISEALREAIRERYLKPQLTENGFTPEAEASLVEMLQNLDPEDVISFPPEMSIEEQLERLTAENS